MNLKTTIGKELTQLEADLWPNNKTLVLYNFSFQICLLQYCHQEGLKVHFYSRRAEYMFLYFHTWNIYDRILEIYNTSKRFVLNYRVTCSAITKTKKIPKFKNQQRIWMDISPKTVHKWPNKHMKTCLTTTIIREMHIKTSHPLGWLQ